MKIYSIETKNQIPIDFSKNVIMAIIKCLLLKDASCVFKFQNDELVDCVFSKRSMNK